MLDCLNNDWYNHLLDAIRNFGVVPSTPSNRYQLCCLSFTTFLSLFSTLAKEIIIFLSLIV